MRVPATVLLLALLLPAGAQQTPQDVSDTVGQGEFPGLQLLPPGSVVKGISLPRYENHRVTALVQIRELRVESRSRVSLQSIAATLFSKDGFRTSVSTPRATYDFASQRAETAGRTTVRDDRFTARGGRVVYNARTQKGLLRGPVRTTVSAAVFGRAANPAPPAPPAKK